PHRARRSLARNKKQASRKAGGFPHIGRQSRNLACAVSSSAGSLLTSGLATELHLTSLMSTASLRSMPRAQISLLSRDQLNVAINLSLKSVICLGGPPVSGCRQILPTLLLTTV